MITLRLITLCRWQASIAINVFISFLFTHSQSSILRFLCNKMSKAEEIFYWSKAFKLLSVIALSVRQKLEHRLQKNHQKLRHDEWVYGFRWDFQLAASWWLKLILHLKVSEKKVFLCKQFKLLSFMFFHKQRKFYNVDAHREFCHVK